MRIPRNLEPKHNPERNKEMINATKPKGLTKNEYNAMLHAIWHLDRLISELGSDGDSENLEILERDRQALSDLFGRIA